MGVSLIISVLVNIILGLILLVLIILLITNYNKPIILEPNTSCGSPICPAPIQTPSISTSAVYTIRTLNGLYLRGCFGCLDAPVACIERGIVASPQYNEDKFKFIQNGNYYQIQYVAWEKPSILPKLYLNMVRKRDEYILCLTENPNQTSAQFEIIPYFSSKNGVNLYQIGSVVTGSLLGEGDVSCLIKEGVPITDGFNISLNAPRGMDERSLFFIIPA
jgi:hypothetical protein